MNYDEMYLIHESDYLDHITDKVSLYIMLKNLTREISLLPENSVSKEFVRRAKLAGDVANGMYRSWGIPARFLRTTDIKDLGKLMEDELIMPEEAGYVLAEEDDDDEEFEYDEDYIEDQRSDGLRDILEFIKDISGSCGRITLNITIE